MIRVTGKFEDTKLLALKTEEGVTVKVCRWSLEARNHQETNVFLDAPKGAQPMPTP